MSSITIPKTAELLLELSKAQTELQAAKSQLQQMQFEASNAPQNTDDTITGEIAKAVREESVRVNLQGVRSAVSILEAREREIRDQLAKCQETERAQQAEADAREAISHMKKLGAKLDKSTAALWETINEMKAVEEQHGTAFRKHLAQIKRVERPNYEEVFRYPQEKLLKIEDLRLPVLRQGNGIDGNITWFANAFVLRSEAPKRD